MTIQARKAKYAKDQLSIPEDQVRDGTGFMGREARLTNYLGRYSHREHAYILSNAAYRRLLAYAADPAWDVTLFGALQKDGVDVPTRRRPRRNY